MSRRSATEDERRQFEEAFAETRPLAAKKHVPDAGSRRSSQALSTQGGLDGRTSERLRRGLIEPQAKLDLHGFTEAAAHRALLSFLRNAHARGQKLTLVVTGGASSRHDPHAPFDLGLDRGPRGVIKRAVPRWLREPEFAVLVAGARPAHKRHGGEGALYIYLRKRSS